MNATPLWFWILGGIVLAISIVLEVQTRKRIKKERE